MKIITSLLIAIVFFVSSCSKKITNSTLGNYNYETTVIEIGKQGTVIVKSWGTNSSIKKAKEEAKRNAVHALLFKGFPNTSNVNSTDLRPLITEANAEQKHRDYFTAFFAENGKYTKFVQFTDGTGSIASGDKIKSGRLYKVAVTVTLYRELLIKELEASGIRKSFGIH